MKGDLTNMQVHATHVPMLRAIGQALSIRRVIEFGCGLFSTKTFLDQRYFPNLASLYSYETDQEWIDKLSFLKDHRWQPTKISESAGHLQNIDYPKNIDLVFVDGPWDHRVRILNEMMDLSEVFVVHDMKKFKKIIINNFKYYYLYLPRSRQRSATAVASNTIDVANMSWKISKKTDFYKWEMPA